MLFLKNKIDGQHKQRKTNDMVNLNCFIFKDEQRKNHKYDKSNNLLDHFQLHQRERSAESLVTDPVGGYLETVFKKGYPPADQNDTKECKTAGFGSVEFQVAIPGNGHKCVRQDQHSNRCESFHIVK